MKIGITRKKFLLVTTDATLFFVINTATIRTGKFSQLVEMQDCLYCKEI